MPKTIKIIVIAIGAAFVFCIGRCFYMIACISCTTPDIETYKYAGTMDQLENGFKQYARVNANSSCKVSWRDNSDNFSARDVNMSIIHKLDTIRYQMVIYDFNKSTRLGLSCIYKQNDSQSIGGCNLKDHGVESLFKNNFQDQFLIDLQKKENIVLKTTLF